MTYTIDDYKKVAIAAGELSRAVEELQEAKLNFANSTDFLNFGKCLDAVFEANKHYNKVNTDCAIEAYEREKLDKPKMKKVIITLELEDDKFIEMEEILLKEGVQKEFIGNWNAYVIQEYYNTEKYLGCHGGDLYDAYLDMLNDF